MILYPKVTTPGQFVNVKITDSTDPILPRPISIAHVDQDKQQLVLIYRIEGKGTELLSRKQKGDVLTIIGPLGNGFPIYDMKRGQKALLVGGGIGTPPLLELSKQLVCAELKLSMSSVFKQKKG